MERFNYPGNELDVFATAKNWKAYWSGEIEKFVGNDILEIGAGIGATAKVFARKRYARWVGVEPDDGLCAVIQQEIVDPKLIANYSLVKGTTASIDDMGTFDTALYIDVLEHIEDDQAELVRVAEKVRGGGRIIVISPAHGLLFSEFDKKIGHYRRYDKKSLRAIVPDGLEVEKLFYLDSVGLLASLANKLFLRSDSPTLAQVQLWDRVMVRLSRILDRITLHRIGKTIVCVLRKPQGNEENAVL